MAGSGIFLWKCKHRRMVLSAGYSRLPRPRQSGVGVLTIYKCPVGMQTPSTEGLLGTLGGSCWSSRGGSAQWSGPLSQMLTTSFPETGGWVGYDSGVRLPETQL